MVKDLSWVFILAIVVIGCIVAYKVYRGPIWVGISGDGKWVATLHKAYEGSAMVYDGELEWKGPSSEEEKVFVTSSQYLVNGKLIAGGKEEGTMPPVSQLGFVMGTRKPKKHDKVEVHFYWLENGKKFNDTIILKRKKLRGL